VRTQAATRTASCSRSCDRTTGVRSGGCYRYIRHLQFSKSLCSFIPTSNAPWAADSQDLPRLTVAFTRAKCKLIVVGSARTLACSAVRCLSCVVLCLGHDPCCSVLGAGAVLLMLWSRSQSHAQNARHMCSFFLMFWFRCLLSFAPKMTLRFLQLAAQRQWVYALPPNAHRMYPSLVHHQHVTAHCKKEIAPSSGINSNSSATAQSHSQSQSQLQTRETRVPSAKGRAGSQPDLEW
jgi:hypothetical protein